MLEKDLMTMGRNILKIHGHLKLIILLSLRKMIIMVNGNWLTKEDKSNFKCIGKVQMAFISFNSITLIIQDLMSIKFQI